MDVEFRVFWLMWALGIGVVLAAGCHHRVDPLMDRRNALLLLEANSGDVPAEHISLEVSKAQVDGLLEQATQLQASKFERVYFSGPMGLPLQAETQMDSADLTMMAGGCDGCVGLDLQLKGNSTLGSGLSNMKAPMTWSIGVQGLLSLDVDGRQISGVPRDDWEVGSTVEGLPNVMNMTAQTTLQNMILTELKKAKLDGPFRLLSIPSSVPFELASAEFQPSDGLGVGLGIHLLESSPVEKRPSPESGWRVRVSETTVKGLLDAFLLSQPVAGGFATDVTELEIGEKITIVLRLIRANKRAAVRKVRLTCHLQVSDVGQVVVDSIVVEKPEKGWHTVGTRFVGARGLRKWIVKSFNAPFKTSWQAQSGAMLFNGRVESVHHVDSELVVDGDLWIEPAPVDEVPKDAEKSDAKGSSQAE